MSGADSAETAATAAKARNFLMLASTKLLRK
jgi:hypothetical protein